MLIVAVVRNHLRLKQQNEDLFIKLRREMTVRKHSSCTLINKPLPGPEFIYAEIIEDGKVDWG